MKSTLRNASAVIAGIGVCLAGSARAAGSVTWTGNAWNYDTGSYPSVALGSNTWSGALEVEVHQGSSYQMWDHGGVYASQSPALHYSDGWFPSVASDVNGNFVEVHMAKETNGNSNGDLWYFLGHESWNGSQFVISWPIGNSYDHDAQHPSVAAWTGFATGVGPYSVVLDVHEGHNGDVWNRVGFPTGSTSNWTGINWQGSNWYDNGASRPSIAIGFGFNYSSVNVVEVHNGNDGRLWMHRGTLDLTTGSINWDYPFPYATGRNPAVAVCPNGTILEVHEEANSSLNSFVGYFYTNAPPGIDSHMVFPESNTSQHYDWGFNPKVACDSSGHGMEVHNGQFGGGGWMWTREFNYQ